MSYEILEAPAPAGTRQSEPTADAGTGAWRPAHGASARPVRDWFASLLACRICWRINAIVFAIILVTEALILVPSASRFEAEQLQLRSDRAIYALEGALRAAALIGPQHDSTTILAQLLDDAGIVGAGILSASGEPRAWVGEPPVALHPELVRSLPPDAGETASQLLYDRQAQRAEFVQLRPLAEAPALLAVRLDTTGVHEALLSYLWRIGALVMFIVLAVALGTMLVVFTMVMKPLLRLHHNLVLAGDTPQPLERGTDAEDEFAEIFEAHNAMLERVREGRLREQQRTEERTRHLSRHDPLSGLPNRAALLEHLQRASSREAPRAGMAVLLVNLVEFGVHNAALGQAGGDELLIGLARRLREAARATDFVAHLGGDGFVVVADPVTHPREAAEYAERLMRDLGEPMHIAGQELRVQARIGIACRESRPFAADQLIGESELALARARTDRRARYQFFLPALGEDARLRQRLARDLELALERGEFQLAYQPKVDARSEVGSPRLTGAEALLRWIHPELGRVRPDAFIEVAESTGLIVPLGEHVFRMACEQIAAWRLTHGQVPVVAVNVSPLQFTDPELTSRLARVLAASGLEPSSIDIEVTETLAMADATRTAEVLQSLRALGVTVSIDDFGTGYSSLAYLRRFPIDAIKIDKSFVDDIGRDPAAESLCSAVIGLGKSLGMRVVAEGVEELAQLEFLRSRGCDEAQGYLFARPLDPIAFEERFLARAATRQAAQPTQPVALRPRLVERIGT